MPQRLPAWNRKWPKNTTVLSKKAFSISKPPLLNIPLSHVVPSPLHLIMGIAMELLKVLEAYCNELDADEELAYKAQGDIYTELENAYLKVGADRRAFHQRFVGNHIRKLLSMDGAKTITEILPESKKRNSIRDLLCRLGSIQSYTKSEFLTELEIAKLDLEILEFRNKYKEFAKTVTALHFTPKFHWLTKHTMEFVKRFNTWGKLNEQPVESVHHQVNLDMTRVGNVRDQIESIPDEEMLIVDEEYLNLLTSNR
uniref:Uncharacterized protein n=1 Tax=Ditylenchus dipsaci TaxID=166011 RepID=A0A915DX70_9BILA